MMALIQNTPTKIEEFDIPSNVSSSSSYCSVSDIEVPVKVESSGGTLSQISFVDYENFLYGTSSAISFETVENLSHVLSGKVLDLVLQHLSVFDLKNVSRVCKNWYKVIASSATLLMKMKLRINAYCIHDDNDIFINLLGSKREYSNVEVVVDNDEETMMFIEAVLMKFSPFIINLSIIKYGGYENFMRKSMPFKNLKTIEIFAVSSKMNLEFLSDTKTLRKITIDGIEQNFMKNLLIQNFDIEELILYENAFIGYLDRDLSSIYMNLKTFSILDHVNSGFKLPGEFPCEKWNPYQRNRLMKFLLFQSPSLQTLRLDKCYAEDFADILCLLPILTHLEINKMIGDIENLKNLKVNSTITTFTSTKIDDQMLDVVLKKFANLQTIFIEYPKIHQYKKIIRAEHSKLTKFCYFWASGNDRYSNALGDLLKINAELEREGKSILKFEVIKVSKQKFLKNYS